jgi:glycerate 2-kinase
MMKKVVLIPDSFKGTLSSTQICEIIEGRVKEHFPECQVISIPVADGGEGSVDCFLTALGGEKINLTVKNPYFEDMDSFYGIIDNGYTAVIEMAACAGLPLVEDRKDPRKTTTYGVGQLILDAANRGVKRIIVGLGGSSTNDCGCGAAAAIGVKFFNDKGEKFTPTGGTTHEISSIDISARAEVLNGIEVVTMCDIDNPMYGPTGASHIFGPQKGANPEMVLFLDEGIKNVSEVIKKDLNKDLSKIPGSGAAGAMGAGMIAFFDSVLQMGIETVLDTVNFSDVITGADMIFTGEGKIDFQSLRGKVVIGVAKRAKLQNVPVTVIAGGADNGIDEAYDLGVTSIFSINRLPEAFETSRYKSVENMTFAVDNILRLIKSVKK